MSTVFERLRAELDQLGDSVQRGLEQGKLRLERIRVARLRDDAARELGLLVYQRIRGQTVDDARYDALLKRLDELLEELGRIDRELAATKGEEVTVGKDPAPPTEPAEAEVRAEPPAA
jgi:hypothetical protein